MPPIVDEQGYFPRSLQTPQLYSHWIDPSFPLFKLILSNFLLSWIYTSTLNNHLSTYHNSLISFMEFIIPITRAIVPAAKAIVIISSPRDQYKYIIPPGRANRYESHPLSKSPLLATALLIISSPLFPSHSHRRFLQLTLPVLIYLPTPSPRLDSVRPQGRETQGRKKDQSQAYPPILWVIFNIFLFTR